MSVVTNLILIMNGIDAGLHNLGPEYDRLAIVNEYFGDMEGLVSVHDDRLPHHWYGAAKLSRPSWRSGLRITLT